MTGHTLHELLNAHPKLRTPALGLIVVWAVVVAGFGFLALSSAHTNAALAKAHNFSACTLGLYLRETRDRQLAVETDPSQSASAQARARDSIPGLNQLIASQVTDPSTYDCAKLLPQLAQGHAA